MPERPSGSSPSLAARLSAVDHGVLRVLRTRGHSPALEAGVIVLARAGENGHVWYVLALGGVLLDPPRRATHLRAGAVVAATLAVNSVIKQAVRRARPALEDLPALAPVISGRSYPSAHAATSFAAARSLPGAAVYVLAVAMALSRPYLGVHYPSDVVAGALLGEAMGRLLGP